MVTMADIRDWARGSDRGAGECQGFVGNDMCGDFGSFTRWYGSALEAAGSSALTGQYPGTPSFAYWVGRSGELLKYGHNGFGTPDEIFMASSRIQTPLNDGGTVGSCSLAHYNSYSDVTFLGWSRTNGQNTMPTVDGGSKKVGQRYMYRAVLRDTKRVAFFDSITFFETTDGSPDDNAWGRFVGKPGLTVSPEEWDAYRRVAELNAATIAGGVASLKPVLDAVAEVPRKTRAEFASTPLK